MENLTKTGALHTAMKTKSRFMLVGRASSSKHQAPKTKHQKNSNFQAPIAECDLIAVCCLGLFWCLELGVWCFRKRSLWPDAPIYPSGPYDGLNDPGFTARFGSNPIVNGNLP